MRRVGDKYKTTKRMSLTAQKEVYLGENIATGETVKVIAELMSAHENLLLLDSRVLACLQGGVGVPRIYYFDLLNGYSVLVTEDLGPSLEELHNFCAKKFSLHTALSIADQLVSRLEFIHNRGFVHLGLSPSSAHVGLGANSDTIYLGDFGHVQRLQEQRSGLRASRIQEGEGTNPFSDMFCSLRAHSTPQRLLTRRDDMESLCYLLIFMLRGTLPWADSRVQGPGGGTGFQPDTIHSLKSVSSLLICEGLPAEIAACLEYSRNMEVDERPDYSFFRKMLRQLALRRGHLIGPGGGQWSWLRDGFDVERWAQDRAGVGKEG